MKNFTIISLITTEFDSARSGTALTHNPHSKWNSQRTKIFTILGDLHKITNTLNYTFPIAQSRELKAREVCKRELRKIGFNRTRNIFPRDLELECLKNFAKLDIKPSNHSYL